MSKTDKRNIIEMISEFVSGRMELILNLRGEDNKPLQLTIRLSRAEFEELAVELADFMELMHHEEWLE